MSTINVNYMTRTYNSFIKSQETRKASGKSMDDTIAEKLSGSEKTGDVQETARTGAISTKDMTIDEYKQYIHDKISEIPLNASRMGDHIAIDISEAGFEAMKNDPEYEEWVLDYLKRDFAVNNPWAGTCGGQYVIYKFGATKEEFHAQGWAAGYQNGKGKSIWEGKSKNSFWERKVENKKRIEAQTKKQQEKKRLQQTEYEKAVMKEKIAHQRFLSDYQNKRLLDGSNASSTTVSSTAASQVATASYETSFMMTDATM